MTDRDVLAHGTHAESLRQYCYLTGLPEFAECANEIDRLQSECDKYREALEIISNLHDDNPSMACADMPPVDYARRILREANHISRAALNSQREGEKHGR